MMGRHFCAYFDHRYFDRGVAMYQSLVLHCPNAVLFVLCLSDLCYETLTRLALPNLIPLTLEEFERGNEALKVAKTNRSLIEYYFTLTPSLLDWLFKTRPEIDVLTYLDSDLYFFSDPTPIFAAFEGYSSLIIPHRFPRARQHMEAYGRYNVGWLSFRRDADGMACLEWWRDRCLEWCYDRLEDGRFADQLYLDRFPELFARVLVLEHPGANLAPWNLGNHRLAERDDAILVDGQQLIFFHFQNFRRLNAFAWRVDHRDNFVPHHGFLARLLYRPYIRALARAHALGIQVGLNREKLLGRAMPRRGRLRNIARILWHGDYVLAWP